MQHSTRFFTMVGIMLVSLATIAAAQTPDDLARKAAAWKIQAADAYEFPVQPWMAEWSEVAKSRTRVAVSQIPDERLTSMSTAGLVETCVNCPILNDIGNLSTVSEGFDQLLREFNGLRALLQRPDAGVALLMKYATIDPQAALQSWDRDHHGNLPLDQFVLIETCLARDAMLAGMPRTARPTLLRESLRVFRAKASSHGDYGGQAAVSAVVMARTLESLDGAPLHRRLAAIPTKDAETLLQELLQARPDLKGQRFEVIPRSAEYVYQELLRYGGTPGGNDDVFTAIVQSAEESLATMTPEGGQP